MTRFHKLHPNVHFTIHSGNTELEKVFELPENEHSVLLMPVGYRVEWTEPFPAHEQKKNLAEIVKYL